MNEYAFGHTDLALQRLKYLASIWAALMETFVQETINDAPTLALDLGCGPGDTTHTLAASAQAKHTVGLDISDHFIRWAKQTETEFVIFQHHDLTHIPFPIEQADLAYSRFVLTHLNKPEQVIDRWLSQLRPQGLLLLEENEWIHSNQKTFRTYLEIVTRMLSEQQNTLCLGPVLARLLESGRWRKRSSQVKRLPVYDYQAATMFYMNIQTWKNRPFVQATYDARMIEDLEASLSHLAQTVDQTSHIEWGMRQVVLQVS